MKARLLLIAVAHLAGCTETGRNTEGRDAGATAGSSAADSGGGGAGGKQASTGGAAGSNGAGGAPTGGRANASGGKGSANGGQAGAAGSGAAGSSTEGGLPTYATDFSGDENPLSEGGVWFNLGLDWTNVQKKGGLAFGTLTGLGGYDDSYARLDGFPPNQEASAIIHYAPGSATDSACTHEVELLMRWSDSSHGARGYECNIGYSSAGTYAQIVRWEGALGSFSPLSGGSPGQIKEGDEVRATAIEDVITVYYNGKQIMRLQDSMYSTGNPGISFFRRDCGANENFAFTSFRATAL